MGGASGKFSPKIREGLKYYVYLYVDPRDGKPFYVGKGKGNRAFSHLNDTSEHEKVERVRELRKLGLEPKIEVLSYGLSEQQALLVECAVIDLIGIKNLTNRFRGHGSAERGRIAIEDIPAVLDAQPVQVKHKALLIRVSQLYYHGMPPQELYDATRGVWKLGDNRSEADYALAVFNGVVREVYEIAGWHPAGTTFYGARSESDVEADGRWEFVGRVAEDAIRGRYLNRSVADYFPAGNRSPVRYVKCGPGAS